MKMVAWVAGTLNQFLEEVLILKSKFSIKYNKAVSGKTPFSVTGPFCTAHSICLSLLAGQFCMEMLRFQSS